MKRSLLALSSFAALFALSACEPTFDKDAIFHFKGNVYNESGETMILGTDADVEICANVTYNVLDGNHVVRTYTHELCRELVTDQEGEYSVDAQLLVRTNDDAHKIQIKNVKLFARKSYRTSSSTTYYVMPADISNVEMRPNGADVEADITIFDI